MKITKTFIVIAIVVALLLFLAGYLIAHANGKAALAEAKAQSEQDKVAVLTGQIKDLAATIAKSEAALAQFQADAKARETWFQGQLAKVATATPQQLVDQGSSIVGAKDITTDGKIVNMGVETYRQFVTIAVDWKEYKDIREPGWMKEKGYLTDQIATYKAQAALDAQKDAALKASFQDLKDYISHQKVAGTLEKILWAAAGAGAGLIAGHLLK